MLSQLTYIFILKWNKNITFSKILYDFTVQLFKYIFFVKTLCYIISLFVICFFAIIFNKRVTKDKSVTELVDIVVSVMDYDVETVLVDVLEQDRQLLRCCKNHWFSTEH